MLNRIAPLVVLCWITAAFGQGSLPTKLGWSQIPNTKIDDVCACTHGFPQVCGVEYCAAIQSWSGGVFDSTRNRLIIWGGGHNAYYGNELYAFNLDTQSLTRLNDPEVPISPCTPNIGSEANSRHTYDGIEYIPSLDKMFVYGGAIACQTGMTSDDTWLFDFGDMSWELVSTSSAPASSASIYTGWDANRNLVWFHDATNLYSFDPTSKTWTRRSNEGTSMGYHASGVIDPVRRRFYVIGPDTEQGSSWRTYYYDISESSNYNRVNQSQSGTLPSGSIRTYPGVAFDPVSDRIVVWVGGEKTYSFSSVTGAWGSNSFGDTVHPGAPSPNQGRGSHGRWRYSPASGVFVLNNQTNENTWIYRLTSGGGEEQIPDTPQNHEPF